MILWVFFHIGKNCEKLEFCFRPEEFRLVVSHDKSAYPKHAVAVALSGSGRSLENLIAREVDFAYSVAAVITSRLDCRGAEVARKQSLPLLLLDTKIDPREQTKITEKWLNLHKIEAVVLAGFLKIFPDLPAFSQRLINIHPALLPDFGGPGMYGNRVHAQVIAAGAKRSGASVHRVTAEYDRGEVLAQTFCAVEPEDNAESLAQKVFALECDLLPRALDHLVRGLYDARRTL